MTVGMTPVMRRAWWVLCIAALMVWSSGTAGAASLVAVVTAPQDYHVVKTVLLTNTGHAVAYNVTASIVLLPPASQYSSLNPLRVEPAPHKLRRDGSGNTVAEFLWKRLRPGQTVKVSIVYTARSYAIRYHLPPVLGSYNHASSLWRTYTNPAREAALVDTDAREIVKLDHRLASPSTPPLKAAQRYFNWIVAHIRYNYKLKAAGSALRVLATRVGICTDFADLYVGMLRTDGIPARLISGYVVNNGLNQAGFHQWVQFWLPHVGWVVADPTWGVDGDFMALHDDWHIALYAGDRPDISVNWDYVRGARAHVAIAYHYAFHREATPSSAGSSASRPS